MKSAEDLGIEGVDEVEALDIEGSAIYRARQFRHNRIVAIKILDAHQEPLVPKRFDLRRKQHQKFAEDEGVVSLYQQGETSAGQQFIIMPFFRIGSLADQLDHGPMPWHRAAELVMRTSEIVARAHDLGVVLGDLKPSSVMLADASSPMISMYGMATRRFDDGTPSYRAPEANRGTNPSPAADVYSLALTLASLIAGRPPNRGPVSAEFLSEVEALAPTRIVQVIEQGLSARSADRHRSARELAIALGTAIRGDQPSFGGNGHQHDDGAAPFDLDALLGLPAPPPPTGLDDASFGPAPTPPAPTPPAPQPDALPSAATAEASGSETNGHSEVLDLESLLERPITQAAPTSEPPPPQLDEPAVDENPADEPALEEVAAEETVLDEAAVEDTAPDSDDADQASADLNGHAEADVNGGLPQDDDEVVIDLTQDAQEAEGSQNGSAGNGSADPEHGGPEHAGLDEPALVAAAWSGDPNGSSPNIETIAAATGEFVPPPPQALGETADATAQLTLGDETSQIILADATQQIALPQTDDFEALQTESAPFEAYVPPPPSAADAIPPAVDEAPLDQPPPPLLTDEPPADVIDLRTAIADEIPADEIPADEIPADEIPADEIPADEIPADEIPADEIPVDEIAADEIAAYGDPIDEAVGDQPPPPLLTDDPGPQAADGTSFDLDELPPPPLPNDAGPLLPLGEADGWPEEAPVTHAAAITGTFLPEDLEQPPPPLVSYEDQVAAVPFGRPAPDLGDEEIPFRAFERQHVAVAAPSPFLRFIDPLQIAWIQIRRSLGALLALIGFAVIAGVVGMVVLRGPQTATTGPNATFTTVQEEGSPSTFLPTSEAPIFVEPPVTHQTTTTRRIIRTTPSTVAPTTAPPTTAAATTRPAVTRPATTRPASTRPVTSRPATSRPPSTRPPTSPPASTAPPSSAATTLPPTTAATVRPTTTRRRRTTTTEDDIGDALEGPTVPLIEDASVSRIRATTAQVQFSSSSCVTASFAYSAAGGSSTTVSGGSRCSRSYNLLLGTVTPRLTAGTTYTVTITATETDGSSSTQRLSFTTLG